MRKILLLIVLFGVAITGLRAQVGIGTKTPNNAALLDITSNSPMKKGLLIPRVQLTGIDMLLTGVSDKASMPNSILVFNTDTFTSTVSGVDKGFGPGYYYWDVKATGTTAGGAWVPLLSGGTSENVQNFFNTVNTSSSTVVYNKASNTFDLSVGNGLANLKDGSGKKYVGLGGSLATNTTIDLGTFKLNMKGLKSSTLTTDEILVIDKVSGELKVVKGLSKDQIDISGGKVGEVLTVEAGKAVWKSITGSSGGGLISGENGITTTGDKVRLGGNLVSPTVITTDKVNTLAIKGLQAGVGTDKVVVVDPASGVLKTVSGVTISQIDPGTGNTGKILTVDNSGVVTWTTIGAGASSTSSSSSSSTIVYNSASNTFDVKVGNGLEEITGASGKYVGLGGTLSKSTTITTDGTNTLAIKGLQAGAGTDKVVVVDPASGVLKTVSGVTISQIDPGTGNTGKILTVDGSGVVTWTSLSGSGGATNTVNFSGIAGDGLTYSTTTGKLNVEGGNGIIVKGGKVNWGGDLTQTATIIVDKGKGFVIKPKAGVKTSSVVIKDLPKGNVSDSFVVVDGQGNLKTVDPKSAAKINYTNGPQDTGRKWTLGTNTMTVQEITFEVTFTNTTSVNIFNELKKKGVVSKANELKVLSIRAIEKTGDTANKNNRPTSITQSGVYDPTTGELTLGMSTTSMFTVTFDGTFYIVLEFIKLN